MSAVLQQTGLSASEIAAISDVLAGCPSVERAVLFGSRAKGSFKRGSDVDLALFGAELSRSELLGVSMRLNQETVLPYQFDLLAYADADSRIREHIDWVGIELYHKQN